MFFGENWHAALDSQVMVCVKTDLPKRTTNSQQLAIQETSTNKKENAYIVSLIFGLAQGGIVPSYAVILREFLPTKNVASKIGLVLMATIFGMAFGGWVSGYIFDLTGSYDIAFINGIIWNIINILLIVYLMFKGSNRNNNVVIQS